MTAPATLAEHGYYEYENGNGATCRCALCWVVPWHHGQWAFWLWDWRYQGMMDAVLDELCTIQLYE